jgi:outer membrane receptor protein involved in Fe transport
MRKYRTLVALFVFALALYSQTTGSILQGLVTDRNGAAIPNVDIVVRNTATGVTTATKTNSAGYFELPPLNPGPYDLTGKIAGFSTYVRRRIDLGLGQRVSVDFALEIARVNESVEVSGAPTVIDTETASASHEVSGELISNLPTFGRNSLYATRLVAGGATSFPAELFSNPSATFGPSDISFNGAPVGGNLIMVDGVADQYGTGAMSFSPTPYSVQEVVVKTFALSAEYGQTAGTVITMETKAGVNRPHGNLWYFHNEEGWNANDFFGNKFARDKQKARHSIFGGNFGGPVYLPHLFNGRNKTFFFADYEGNRDLFGYRYFNTVPTALERQGNFSQSFAANGKQIQIYDPFSTRFDPANPGVQIRDPFPGNVIPADRINPIGVNILKYVPLPNLPGESNNLLYSFGLPDDSDSYHFRIDENFNEKNTLFFSYGRLKLTDIWPGTIPGFTQGYTNHRKDQLGALGYTHIFSPTLVFNLRGGIQRDAQTLAPFNDIVKRETLGFPASFTSVLRGVDFPLIGGSDMAALGYATQGTSFVNPDVRAYATKIAGRHSLTIGYEARLYRTFQPNRSGESGSFFFGRDLTQGPTASVASANAGHSVAALLLGTPSSGSVTFNVDPAAQATYDALYVQDNWRLTPKLSLNLGLRWDYQGPITERFNRLNRGFDLNAASPIAAEAQANYAAHPQPVLSTLNVRGGLLFANTNGQPRAETDPDYTNFMPRLGVAYQFAPKTVLRAGWGLYYLPFQDGLGSQYISQATLPITSLGFSSSTAMQTTLNGLPVDTLSNPFPQGLVQPVGSSLGLSTLLGQSITFVDPQAKRAHAQQFQVSLERELPGRIGLDVAYVGSRVAKLPILQPLNALPVQYLQLRDQLTAAVANPFSGLIKIGALSQPTISTQQLLLPYPQFTAVNENFVPKGAMWYDSLQVSATKRFSAGVQFLASYTRSKNMQELAYLNPTDTHLEHVITPIDRPNRFVFSGEWDIPFGSGKKFGNDLPGAVRFVLGNWETSWIATVQSGQPVGPWPRNAMLTRPIQPVDQTVDRWFDTGEFTTLPPYTLSTLSTYTSWIRADGTHNVDFILSKNFPIRETVGFRLKAELFNITNTPQFAAPSTSVTSTSFGGVFSQSNNPRWFTLGGTLNF